LSKEKIKETPKCQAHWKELTGTPMKFSRTPCKIQKACPDVGQDTEEILKNLGMV